MPPTRTPAPAPVEDRTQKPLAKKFPKNFLPEETSNTARLGPNGSRGHVTSHVTTASARISTDCKGKEKEDDWQNGRKGGKGGEGKVLEKKRKREDEKDDEKSGLRNFDKIWMRDEGEMEKKRQCLQPVNIKESQIDFDDSREKRNLLGGATWQLGRFQKTSDSGGGNIPI